MIDRSKVRRVLVRFISAKPVKKDRHVIIESDDEETLTWLTNSRCRLSTNWPLMEMTDLKLPPEVPNA